MSSLFLDVYAALIRSYLRFGTARWSRLFGPEVTVVSGQSVRFIFKVKIDLWGWDQ